MFLPFQGAHKVNLGTRTGNVPFLFSKWCKMWEMRSKQDGEDENHKMGFLSMTSIPRNLLSSEFATDL